MSRPRPRVLVVGTRVGSLPPPAVATAVATGFAPTMDVAAIGLAAGGADLGTALARAAGGRVESVPGGWVARGADWLAVGAEPGLPTTGVPVGASSASLGRLLARVLAETARPARVIVDLTGSGAHDAGAGLLAELGATADVPLDRGATGLRGATRVELRQVVARLAGVELIGVVDLDERDDRLLGLRGLTARRGRAAGADPAVMLAVDAALADFAHACVPRWADEPGAGAAGGGGYAVLALGGRLLTGPAVGAELAGLEATVSRADLVVAACESFDIGNQGGPVVRELAVRASAAERPLIVLAGAVGMSAREMRTVGVEWAYEVADLGSDAAAALARAAGRAAAGWAR